MKNFKRISRHALKTIHGGNVNCPVPGSSVPAICPGTRCPANPCATPNCIIPVACSPH
ncbi:hypothetical protein AAEU33_04030 [Chryseobacterium sp. Chry.R1]|uniref:bacteriocin-like protein n=1 Tax=Chryseobacterium sp. Chry.R1 TaxID=3139392 RepID=UPI0031FA2727